MAFYRPARQRRLSRVHTVQTRCHWTKTRVLQSQCGACRCCQQRLDDVIMSEQQQQPCILYMYMYNIFPTANSGLWSDAVYVYTVTVYVLQYRIRYRYRQLAFSFQSLSRLAFNFNSRRRSYDIDYDRGDGSIVVADNSYVLNSTYLRILYIIESIRLVRSVFKCDH